MITNADMIKLIQVFFILLIGCVILLIITYLIKMLTAGSIEEKKFIKKQLLDSLSKKDRFRKAWDKFWGHNESNK